MPLADLGYERLGIDGSRVTTQGRPQSPLGHIEGSAAIRRDVLSIISETIGSSWIRASPLNLPYSSSVTLTAGASTRAPAATSSPVYACEDFSKHGFYRDCHDRATCVRHDDHSICEDESEEFARRRQGS